MIIFFHDGLNNNWYLKEQVQEISWLKRKAKIANMKQWNMRFSYSYFISFVWEKEHLTQLNPKTKFEKPSIKLKCAFNFDGIKVIWHSWASKMCNDETFMLRMSKKTFGLYCLVDRVVSSRQVAWYKKHFGWRFDFDSFIWKSIGIKLSLFLCRMHDHISSSINHCKRCHSVVQLHQCYTPSYKILQFCSYLFLLKQNRIIQWRVYGFE